MDPIAIIFLITSFLLFFFFISKKYNKDKYENVGYEINSELIERNKYDNDHEVEFIFSKSSKNLILLIEDDPDMRELLSGYLENSGFDILKSEDGIKGQASALQYSPDLILLELMLPYIDGLTLCQRLKRDKRTSDIPILMITALGGLKDKLKVIDSGADDYITKPFSLEELDVRIKSLLRSPNSTKSNYSNKKTILSSRRTELHYKCRNCGANLNPNEETKYIICEYCGTRMGLSFWN